MAAKPLCVVLDTNIWLSRRFLLLKTPLSAALLFALGRRGGRVGLPEVLESEIVKQLSLAAVGYATSLEAARSALEDMGAKVPATFVLPTAELEALPKERLDALADYLVRTPMTIDHARRALAMVNGEVPPNGPKNQQFKDSLIWQSLFDLAGAHDVVFVTTDKGFFERRDPKLGLAGALARECDLAPEKWTPS
jgi:hypothetical protein